MNRLTAFVLGCAFTATGGFCAWRVHHLAGTKAAPADPTIPVVETYLGIHQAILERNRRGPVGVLFLGDSITDFWRTEPWLWDEAFGEFQPSNAGIAFDQVQNVLWRVGNGELDGIHPRVIVLLIGTNNFYFGHDDGKITASGVANLIRVIRVRLPEAKILLLGLLPRHGTFDAEVASCNRMMARMEDGAHVFYLDPGAAMPAGDFSDQLHPNPEGYRHLARLLVPRIRQLYDDVQLTAK